MSLFFVFIDKIQVLAIIIKKMQTEINILKDFIR